MGASESGLAGASALELDLPHPNPNPNPDPNPDPNPNPNPKPNPNPNPYSNQVSRVAAEGEAALAHVERLLACPSCGSLSLRGVLLARGISVAGDSLTEVGPVFQ